jgi:purine-nucleoside phosphorylase
MSTVAEQRRRLTETGNYLMRIVRPWPELGIIAGTGLGDLAAGIEVKGTLPYGVIPHFPVSTVPGHQGQLVWGTLEGTNVLIFQGRFHLYEGYDAHEVTFPLRVAARCGLRFLVLTNAAGGLDPAFRPGDIMLITDQINLMGENPLVGPHDPEWGERFPDMSAVYDAELQALAVSQAAALGIELRRGVYAGVGGPSLETPAETRFYRLVGATAVGMSTVQEAIAGVQAGLRLLGLSIITNVNIPEQMRKIALEDVLRVAAQTAPRVSLLLHGMIRNWPRA